MCFSAEASFSAGAALLPAGLYCTRSALRKDPRYVPLALVPIAFGLQQFSEGFVWRGLMQQDAILVQQASVVFLFFAVVFWPFWIPLSLALPESRTRVRAILASFAVGSLVWVWLYAPLVVEPQKYLTTEIMQHSIRYDAAGLPGFALLPRPLWRFGYLLAICIPLAIGRLGPDAKRAPGAIGGAVLAVLFGVSYGIYWYAFLSVWCFFAALLSLALCIAFYQLPARTPSGIEARVDERSLVRSQSGVPAREA